MKQEEDLTLKVGKVGLTLKVGKVGLWKHPLGKHKKYKASWLVAFQVEAAKSYVVCLLFILIKSKSDMHLN